MAAENRYALQNEVQIFQKLVSIVKGTVSVLW